MTEYMYQFALNVVNLVTALKSVKVKLTTVPTVPRVTTSKIVHKCFNCYTSKNEAYKKLSSSHNCFTPSCPMLKINKFRIIQNTDFGISNPTINAVDYE